MPNRAGIWDNDPMLVGREKEIELITACIQAGRNVLLEGPVGVGKTHLALEAVRGLKTKSFRVDGDQRFTEQKLCGWFDPPLVVKEGFAKSAFVPGPLIEAMQSGSVLLINELNRLPEGVQNVLLPAIDERFVSIPKLGKIEAKKGFSVIATQNPKEFVATSHLSEAILDRFDLIRLDYQTEEEEQQIVRHGIQNGDRSLDPFVEWSVALARLTRDHSRIRRGASVRGALGVAQLSLELVDSGYEHRQAFEQAAIIALPTRIEVERGVESANTPEEVEELIRTLVATVLGSGFQPTEKKTPNPNERDRPSH